MEGFYHDICTVAEYFKTGEPFLVTYKVAPKVEHFWTPESESYTEEEWAAKINKLRLFVMCNGPMMAIERIISQLRHHIEQRGGCIRVGKSYSRGGAQMLAEQLKITEAEAFHRIM